MTIAEIAQKLGATFEGDGAAVITGVAGIRDAGAGEIAFVANPKYAADAANTRATAVIVKPDWNRPCGSAAIIRAPDPDRAFAQVVAWFAPSPVIPPPGVHPTAVVAPDARLGADVSVGPLVVIESGAEIGARTSIAAQSYIGRQVIIGEDCRIYQQVSIREYCRIGSRTLIHNGTVIGSDGFGYNVDAQGVRTKIPQVGIVWIGDDVEIGANVTVDRARFGKTRIGNGAKIDNLVQIAHNVQIGEHVVLVAQVGISGSTEVGPHAILAGQVGVAGHLVIGAGAICGAKAGIHKDVPPKAYMFGYPAEPFEKASKAHAHLMRMGEWKERVMALEKRVKELEARWPQSKDG